MKLLKYAGIFFLACLFIYLGVGYLVKVWPALLIVAAVVAVITIIVRINTNRPKW